MDRRAELKLKLEAILGSKNVYFQPPETVKLSYPCIIYKLSNITMRHANNDVYNYMKRYSITIIDRNPESIIPESLLNAKLPYCSFSRHYTADGLNHYAFELYF